MDISSQPCFITGGSDLEDSWSILRFCCSQTQEDSPVILLSSPIVPKCLKHAVSENHCLNPFRVRHSAPIGPILRRSPQVPMGLHTVGCCGWSFVGTPAAESAGSVAVQPLSQRWELREPREPARGECRTAGISQWYQPYHGDILGIWEEYLIIFARYYNILQDITTYYKMEPKLSMWQNDANITLAKLLEVHEIQLAHLVDSTYRLVDPHVRC